MCVLIVALNISDRKNVFVNVTFNFPSDQHFLSWEFELLKLIDSAPVCECVSVSVMSPLALMGVEGVCVLNGHMTLRVINTWQCCCLAWRSVTQGTARSYGIGSAAWDTVFWFLFEIHSSLL